MRPIPTLFACCAASVQLAHLQAQTPLPYSTGFDDDAQQSGWQSFRSGAPGSAGWELLSGGAPSAPYFLWHDYVLNVHEGDTICDWFVSPAFDFIEGARFAGMELYVNAITGVIDPADALGVYLLVGSGDPTAAASVQLLCDLTAHVSGTTDWVEAPQALIPPVAGECHIAILYRASTNQFTLSVDDLRLEPMATGIGDAASVPTGPLLYPNPAFGQVAVSGAASASQPYRLRLFDARGALVEDRTVPAGRAIGLDHAPGRYTYMLEDGKNGVLRRGTLVIAR